MNHVPSLEWRAGGSSSVWRLRARRSSQVYVVCIIRRPAMIGTMPFVTADAGVRLSRM